MGAARLSPHTGTGGTVDGSRIHSKQVICSRFQISPPLSVFLSLTICLSISVCRIFVLDIPNHAVMERLTNRQMDKVTGDRFHSVFNPAPAVERVQDRLTQHPRDNEDEVQRRLSRYHTYIEELTDFYVNAQTVPADQDIHTVFEMIESFLVNPIPKKYI